MKQLNEATRLMNEAQAAVAEKAPFAERVRRARLPLDHAWIKRFNDLERLAAKAEGKTDEGPKDKSAAITAFLAEIKHFDVRVNQEWNPIARSRRLQNACTHRLD